MNKLDTLILTWKRKKPLSKNKLLKEANICKDTLNRNIKQLLNILSSDEKATFTLRETLETLKYRRKHFLKTLKAKLENTNRNTVKNHNIFLTSLDNLAERNPKKLSNNVLDNFMEKQS